MYLNKTNSDQLMKRFSDPKNILRNLLNNEKEKTCKEIENAVKDFRKTKEDLIKETKEVFKYSTSYFKTPSAYFNFKYKLEELNKGGTDYDALESALKLDSKTEEAELNEVLKLLDSRITYKIYRVKANKKPLQESKDSESSSLFLLHGTKGPRVEGILKEGFKPSKSGSFGPGVYLTNSFCYAFDYGNCFVNDEGVPKNLSYLFVNKVRETSINETSTKLRKNTLESESEKNKISFASPKNTLFTYKNGKKMNAAIYSRSSSLGKNLQDYAKNEPALKVFEGICSKTQTSFKNSSQDRFDSKNIRISKGTFHYNKKNEKIAVAHHDLVTPAYLIEVEFKNVQDVVEGVLYKKLFVHRFTKQTSAEIMHQSLSKTPTNISSSKTTSRYTSEQFYLELEAEIERNHKAQVELIKSKFDKKVALLTRQLSFEVSSLFQTDYDSSILYKTEELQPSNEDYQFILSLVSDKTPEKNKKILYIFRINPVDQNEVRKIHNASLYLHGIKSDKVMNVLKSGYPKGWDSYNEKCKKECSGEDTFQTKNCSCRVSNILTKELSKGTSLCTLEGEVKELSFVFVLGYGKVNIIYESCAKKIRLSGEKYHEKGVNRMDFTMSSDSRGCQTFSGSFKNPKNTIDTQSEGMVPAYLLVFDA